MATRDKYNAKIVKQIGDYVRQGNTFKDAAILCDITEETFYKWKREKPEFAEALKKAEAYCKGLHVRNVRRHALGEEGFQVRWTASAWWLERRYPEEFGLKWQGELAGKGGKPLIPEDKAKKVDTSRFTKEQLDKLIVATDLLLKNGPPKSEEPANGNGTNGTH